MNLTDNKVHIRLDTLKDVTDFSRMMSHQPGSFAVENRTGSRRVDAKSVIGIMYAMMDFGEEMFLVRDSKGDTPWPADIRLFMIA